MKEKRCMAIGSISVLVLAATIGIFCLTKRNITMSNTWLGFGFVLWSEIVFFGGLIFREYLSDKVEQVFFTSGFISAIAVYSIINLIISIVYLSKYTAPIKSYVIFQIVWLCLLVIVVIIVLVTSNTLKKKNDNVLDSVNSISVIIDELYDLPVYSEYDSQIDKIIEELKYSNTAVRCKEDEIIESKVAQLDMECVKEEKDDDKIEEILVSLLQSAKKRKRNSVEQGRI